MASLFKAAAAVTIAVANAQQLHSDHLQNHGPTGWKEHNHDELWRISQQHDVHKVGNYHDIFYRVVREGEGYDRPVAESEMYIHYHAETLEGVPFENSYRAPDYPLDVTPSEFRISGMQEVLQMMAVGSKYEMWIPSKYSPFDDDHDERFRKHSAHHWTIEFIRFADDAVRGYGLDCKIRGPLRDRCNAAEATYMHDMHALPMEQLKFEQKRLQEFAGKMCKDRSVAEKLNIIQQLIQKPLTTEEL